MNNLNEVVYFLVDTTYKALKKRTGRTPGITKVFMIITLIVTNNYEDCLNKLLETEIIEDDELLEALTANKE